MTGRLIEVFGRLLYHISKLEITFGVFTGPNRKEPPKPSLMTIKEIESDDEPSEDDVDYENR